MRQDAEKHGAVWAKKNDDRVTLGKVSSQDPHRRVAPDLKISSQEKMSFIDPVQSDQNSTRTWREKIPHYALRHIVRPGITGGLRLCTGMEPA